MTRICNNKLVLNVCNFLFLLSGTTLIVSGFYLFTDTRRILLSRLLAATSEQLNNLPQPLFYYISIGLTMAGLVAVLAAIVGFWAACLNTYCFLSIYFLTVVALLLAESVVCLAITLWPHCLGISLDEGRMVKVLQNNYGVPGKEQFTVAMDLAQTRFHCCGMNSDSNFDMSLWKLQGYGQRDWTVPLTCCLLGNAEDKLSYLDPKPANETLCQSLQKTEHERHRYSQPCLQFLDNWYREQYVLFLGASLVLAIVEFCVLLSIILTCSRISAKSIHTKNAFKSRRRSKPCQRKGENIYEPDVELRSTNILDMRQNTSATFSEDFKDVYVQPRDLYKHRHNTTFKPVLHDYSYQNRSYLV